MRLRFLATAASVLLSGICFAQNADMPAADSSSLDFSQWGLLAIQDGEQPPLAEIEIGRAHV